MRVNLQAHLQPAHNRCNTAILWKGLSCRLGTYWTILCCTPNVFFFLLWTTYFPLSSSSNYIFPTSQFCLHPFFSSYAVKKKNKSKIISFLKQYMTSPNTKCVMVLKSLWKISGTGDCVWDTHFSCLLLFLPSSWVSYLLQYPVYIFVHSTALWYENSREYFVTWLPSAHSEILSGGTFFKCIRLDVLLSASHC